MNRVEWEIPPLPGNDARATHRLTAGAENDAPTDTGLGTTEALSLVRSGEPGGTRGRTFAVSVEVGRKRRGPGTVERAPDVPKELRREVRSGWLADGRYQSLRELAEAVGFSTGFVRRVLRGER